jgi:chromate transporter
MLVMMAALPFWHELRALGPAQAAVRGVNAAVVGLLGAALYTPVWTSAVQAPADVAVAATGFVLLTVWRAPPLIVALIAASAGIGLAAGR